ncbi:hypothetical protein Q5P01_011075 [Channa striata]|uniref:TNFR-Cys domain-containing protein n=1 Tax=Channa striata TaxID=64152 RepID=A0AA88MSK6_CHASR|nr:hypothetical protein Q5P01_011075 [Channa striata]
MGLHSYKCRDPATRWNGSECVDCPRKAGHEVSPNCGYSDDGGRHEPPLKPCPGNTFNDGSTAMCRTCSSCQTGFEIVSPCNPTTDTKCEQRHPTSTVHPTEPQTTRDVSVFSDNTTSVNGRIEVHKESEHNTLLWAVPLILFISFMLVLSACIIYKKWKKGKHTVLSFSRSSLIERQFPPFCAPAGDVDLENILSPNILSAPLQTVLDNLDVLEELVILLDPESPTVKNTKHLASLCHFPSTWITYTYSMKESKSPLKAVIEGVSSRNPDWTIEHLAKRLRLIERNDAIAVLAKLQLNSIVQ